MTEFTIDRLHFCGDGIAMYAGRPIRIANALPGETVIGQDVSIKRRRQALLIAVQTPSNDRVAPVCPHWQRCPACQFQCMDSNAQSLIKQTHWIGLIGKFVPLPDGCDISFFQAPQKLGYRCRTDALVYHNANVPMLGIAPRLDVAAQELANDPAANLMELDTADVQSQSKAPPIPLVGCPLHAPELNALLKTAEPLVGSFAPQTHFSFEAYKDSKRIIVYAAPELANDARRAAHGLMELPDVTTILQVLPPRGSHVYPPPEILAGTPYHCYAHNGLGQALYALKGAWIPVNPTNAALIRSAFSQMIDKRHFGHVLEIGCGCGTNTDAFLAATEQYTGIDAVWPAILSAQYNAERYGWKNVRFFTDSAEHYLDKRYYKGVRADCIVLHSNRMPYAAHIPTLCKRFGARDIFIAAPTAFAIAQECRHLCQIGYTLNKLLLCDTLPMTYHMMATAHLSLVK